MPNHTYTKRDKAYVLKHYNRDMMPKDVAAHIGVSTERIRAQAVKWRKQGLDIPVYAKPVGTVRQMITQGAVITHVKTATGWQYISGKTINPKRKGPVPKPKLPKVKKEKKPPPPKIKPVTKKEISSKAQAQNHRKARQDREQRRMYKTRTPGPLVSVKINEKTYVMVPADRVAAVKQKYNIAS